MHVHTKEYAWKGWEDERPSNMTHLNCSSVRIVADSVVAGAACIEDKAV